ncbi:MAG: hypothetical protein ACRDU4_17255 [Mycobacterium sp.]
MTGSNDYNGEVFEEQVNNAVNTAYNDAMANPVVSANGQITDVVFSGGGLISAWPLMNVNNPDVAIFVPLLIDTLAGGNANGFIANSSITEVEGNPEDGWTLVSFDGQPMPAYPGLLSELIVDVRNLITPPQTAAYNLFEAALTGVSTTIGGAPVEVNFTTVEDALQAGIQSVGTAIAQFPGAVINDIADAVQKLAADVAAGETFSDAFGTVILGLA